MDRRTFLEKSALSAAALSALSTTAWAEDKKTKPASAPDSTVTAGDVQNHLRNMGKRWIPLDSKNTVDTLKAGSLETKVTGIATCWMGYTNTIQEAHDAGCNVMVVHEPIYYNHRDKDPTGFALEGAKRKKKLIEKLGMTILRCHDVWDRVEGTGICDTWAEFLGFTKEINRPANLDPTAARPYWVAYEIEPTKSGDLAAAVATTLKEYNQPNVMLVGPTDKVVRSVAVGTGACTRFNQMVTDLKVDLTICSDDGFTFWRDGALAIDMDFPVIIAAHSSSEEIGMKKMSKYLTTVFPQVPIKHLDEKCMYQQIGPKA